jgi:hypothetical protein
MVCHTRRTILEHSSKRMEGIFLVAQVFVRVIYQGHQFPNAI